MFDGKKAFKLKVRLCRSSRVTSFCRFEAFFASQGGPLRRGIFWNEVLQEKLEKSNTKKHTPPGSASGSHGIRTMTSTARTTPETINTEQQGYADGLS